MAFIAIYDACVLFPNALRDLLIRLASTSLQNAVRDCIVDGYQDLVEAIKLPDPDDRHVLAAAIRAGAQVIVTFNQKDFPSETLDRYDIEAQHPDDFVLHVVNLDVARVAHTVEEQARALKKPPMKATELLDRLQARGLPQAVAALRAHVVDDDA